MVERLEPGTKLQAKYTDGVFYAAEVVKVSTAKKKSKAPVEVFFRGYPDSTVWLALSDLKSKLLPKEAPQASAKGAAKAKAKPEAKTLDYSALEKGTVLQAKGEDGVWYSATVVTVAKAKAKSKAPVKVNYTGYTATSDEWLGGDRLRSKLIKAQSKPAAPVMDYSALEKGSIVQAKGDDGIWYSASVVTVAKAQAKSKAPVKVNYRGYTSASDEWLGADRLRSKLIKARETGKAKASERAPRPALQMVPILKRLAEHAKKELPVAVIESSAKGSAQKMPYATLLAGVQEISDKIARLLAKRPDGSPKHVAFLVNPSIAYVVVELSIWAVGGLCVPLSVHSPAPELEYFVTDSEACVLIADAASSSKLKPVAEKLSRIFGTIEGLQEAQSQKFTLSSATEYGERKEGDTDVTMKSDALILYTSGTTGQPKGVVHTFSSLSAQYVSLSKAWKWSSKDQTLHVLPLHHIHGVQNILNTAMYNGAAVEFTPFDAGFCLQRLCSGDITCFHAVPTIYVKFTQHLEKLDADARAEIHKGLRNGSMRYMVSGSAALPVPTMSSWAEISGHVLLERYGMTEIGMGLSNKITGTRYPGCVGWPLPFARAKTDADGAILIKAPQVFDRYYKREEATKKEFTDDGWFRTGDNCSVGGTAEELQQIQDDAIALEKAAGRASSSTTEKPAAQLSKIYKILGRTSVDIIKSGGYKISALEIESVLLQHEAIKECAVIGKEDETWGEKVTAICVLQGALTIKELRDWGKERMATYKVPQELITLDELPRNQMGKLEKTKLMDKYKK